MFEDEAFDTSLRCGAVNVAIFLFRHQEQEGILGTLV